MEEKIDKGSDISASEMEEKRDWDQLIDWCQEKERDFPLVEAFLISLQLANMLQSLGFPERTIKSAWVITAKLETKVRALKA